MAMRNTRLAQAVKPRAEINEMQSLQLTRNLIRIAISEITYIRGLFPEKYFLDRYLPALEMNVKKLMPVDMESRRIIDWMEKGVYDALQKKYLETLLFRLRDGEFGPLIEEYAFSFRYDICSGRVSMDITRSNSHGGKGKPWKMSTSTSELTPAQMKAAACKMIRTLVQLMRTLNYVPEQRTIVMQLYYHADTTPADYEPPYFRSCTYEDTKLWTKRPLIMKVGTVNSKHCEVSLKVRSILDPSEDDEDICVKSEDKMAEETSSTTGSEPRSKSHDFTSRGGTPCPSSKHSWPLSEKKHATTSLIEDVQLQHVREDKKAELNDELVGHLVKNKFLENVGEDKYRVTNFEEHKVSFRHLSKDAGLSTISNPGPKRFSEPPSTDTFGAAQDTADDEKMRLYEKAVALVIRMKYVTVRELTDKLVELGENVNPFTVNKLLQRMGKEGYIKIILSSRKLGHLIPRPLQESEDHLQEIVEGVKDVTIAEADESSEEGSISEETKAELRTKSRADFVKFPECKKNPELRTKSECDSIINSTNAYELRSKKKTDLCATTSGNVAKGQHTSDDPTLSLGDISGHSSGFDERIDNKMQCLLTEVAGDEESNHNPPLDASHITSSQVERLGLPRSSYGGTNKDNTHRENLEKSHYRVRKASKVEEPIFQCVKTKRMRS